MAEEKKISPLTQYIRWLKASNLDFPEDAKKLYIGTLFNLTEDDWASCIIMNSMLNEDPYLPYKFPPEMFGDMHKSIKTKDNPQFVRSGKKIDKDIIRAVRSVEPHLKESQIEQLLDLIPDKDTFLKSLGYGSIVSKATKVEASFDLLESNLRENLELKCPTCSNNNQYVFFDSNTESIKDVRCLFIGEAPADKEIVEGKPFVGKSGQLLRETIAKVDPTIKWMISNTCLCYHKAGTPPTETEIACCFDNLETILETLDKNVVLVPLGRTALTRLGIFDKATDAIKKIYKYGKYTVVPNVHPSYILRGGMSRESFEERMREVADVLNGTNKKRGKRTDKTTAEDVLKTLNGEIALPLEKAIPESVSVVEAKNIEEEIPVVGVDELPPISDELASTIANFLEGTPPSVGEKVEVEVVTPVTSKPKKHKKEADHMTIIQPPIMENKGPMLVDTVYDQDKGVVYHIQWDGSKKEIIEIPDDVVIHKGHTERSVEQRSKLGAQTIRYKDRWKHIKDTSIATFGADVSIAVHKNIEWRKNHPDEQLYKIKVCLIDIECYTNHEPLDFSDLEKAASRYPISLVTVYDNYANVYYTLLYNLNNSEINEDEIKKNLDYADDCQFVLKSYDTEQEMLKDLQKLIDEIDPMMISGWNSDGFDFPFLKARYEYLGMPYKNKYGGGISLRTYQREGILYTDAEIKFMHALDYMRLYKEMMFNKRESYSLGFISKYELGVTKLELEGHMDEVFDNDINRFIAYNINDVHLIRLLDNKLKYVDLMYGIVRITNISLKEAFTTLRVVDGLIYTYLMEKDLTCRVRPADNSKENLLGAYVRTPIKGTYEWVSDLDLSSLYPYIMARFNLSKDTYIGKVDEEIMYNYMYHKDVFFALPTIHISLSNGKEGDVDPQRLDTWITENKYIVTIAGTIFKSHEEEQSILYEVIDMMIKERRKYEKMRKEAESRNDDQLQDRYDNMQMTYKVITNSIYGAMGNAGFRFFSNELAQTITKTGRELSRLGAYMVNEYFRKMIEEKRIDIDPVELDPDFPSKAENNLEHIIYGDSVVGESKIYSNGKAMRIEDLWNDAASIHPIFCDETKERIYLDSVKTLTVDGDQPKESDVEYIMRHKVSKPIYRIEADNGRFIDVTEDHSIIVLNDKGELVEKKPTDLAIGDTLVVAPIK